MLGRLVFSAALILVSSHAVLADDNITGLQGVMRDMGAQMGVIAGALLKGTPTDAAALTAAADRLLADVDDSRGRLPTELVDANGKALPEQAAAIQQYDTQMSQLHDAVAKLDQAIQAGDRATAKTILTTEVQPLQHQGHDTFRKDSARSEFSP